MAQDANQKWTRTEGVLITQGANPDEVATFLQAQQVIARLEWHPSSTNLISVNTMTDAKDRVAVTPPQRGGAAAGMSVSELAEMLAHEFNAEAILGPASFDALPEDAQLPDVGGVDDSQTRTVVVSPLSAYTVPLQATLLERSLVVLPAAVPERRLVMYTGEGNELGTYGWDDEALPAVVLSASADDYSVQAIFASDEEDDALYSWSLQSRYVTGSVDKPGKALQTLLDEVLADGADAAAIAGAVPGADAEKVAQALDTEGAAGLRALVEALGLPSFVSDVLAGELDPQEVPGAVLHDPRGLSNAVGRSVGMMLSDPGTPGSEFWNNYVTTVTERPWLVRTVCVLEASLGGTLVGAALRRREKAGKLPAGLVAAGVVLMVDAVAEVSLASSARHHELRRRADAEMTIISEELGL